MTLTAECVQTPWVTPSLQPSGRAGTHIPLREVTASARACSPFAEDADKIGGTPTAAERVSLPQ